MVSGQDAPVLTTDPSLLDYRNRSGLARVEAGELRALAPQSAGGGPHLALIRAAFAIGLLPTVDVPEDGYGLQELLDLGLEERLGTLEDLPLALDVWFEDDLLTLRAGAPRDPNRSIYRHVPLEIDMQPLVDAFGLRLALNLTRELGRILAHHVGVWSISDAKGFSDEVYELEMGDDEALKGVTAAYLKRWKLTEAQIDEDGPAKTAYLDYIADEYPNSATGHLHLFRHSLYREDWPELSELGLEAQRVYRGFEARLKVLEERFRDGYREGASEEELRDDDDNSGPIEEAIVLTLNGREGEFLMETWHDRAEMYLNQRAPLIPPLLMVLDSVQESVDERLQRLDAFLTSFERLDLSVKDLRAWIDEVGAWHAQAEQAGPDQTPLFPVEVMVGLPRATPPDEGSVIEEDDPRGQLPSDLFLFAPHPFTDLSFTDQLHRRP